MKTHWYLCSVACAVAVLVTEAPVMASHVSFEVSRPVGPFPKVGGHPSVIVKQGSTLEAVIRVGETPTAESDQVGDVFRQQLRWIVAVRLATQGGQFGPSFSVRPVTVGGVPQPIIERVNVPIDLPCGMHELRACAIYLAPGSGVSEPRTYESARCSPLPRLPLYVDCSAPGLDVHAPSEGACIRPGTSVDLRLTASDDIGIRSLTHDLGPLGRQQHLLTALAPSHTFTIPVALSDPHRSGVISANFVAEDWAGNKVGKGFTITLDGSQPPTIGMERPSDGQQATTVDSLTVSGPAADPGCGLDRIEIGVRKRGTSDAFRIVKTIRDFPSAHRDWPTPSLTYRAELPAGTLAPGVWDLRAEAISQTGRRAELTRYIRVVPGPTLAPSPPAGPSLLPPLPRQRPVVPPSR